MSIDMSDCFDWRNENLTIENRAKILRDMVGSLTGTRNLRFVCIDIQELIEFGNLCAKNAAEQAKSKMRLCPYCEGKGKIDQYDGSHCVSLPCEECHGLKFSF